MFFTFIKIRWPFFYLCRPQINGLCKYFLFWLLMKYFLLSLVHKSIFLLFKKYFFLWSLVLPLYNGLNEHYLILTSKQVLFLVFTSTIGEKWLKWTLLQFNFLGSTSFCHHSYYHSYDTAINSTYFILYTEYVSMDNGLNWHYFNSTS